MTIISKSLLDSELLHIAFREKYSSAAASPEEIDFYIYQQDRYIKQLISLAVKTEIDSIGNQIQDGYMTEKQGLEKIALWMQELANEFDSEDMLESKKDKKKK